MILVEPLGEEYRVSIEVSEDVEYDIDGEPVLTPNTLFLHWGLHREWLDEWMCLPDLPRGSEFSDDDPRRPATRTPLIWDGEGNSIALRNGFPLRFSRTKFVVPAYFAPVEVDFVIVETDSVTGKTIAYDWPRGALKWPHVSFAIPIGMERGRPEPLGASRASPNSIGPGYVNFALHSAIAEKVTLFLQWSYGNGNEPETIEIALNPTIHRTGDVWHVALPIGIPGGILPLPAKSSTARIGASGENGIPAILYGYKCDGDPKRGGWRHHPGLVMFDPRATSLQPPLGKFQDPLTRMPKYLGSLADVMNGGSMFQLAYDAGPIKKAADGYRKLRQIPAQEIIYELSIADFTSHVSSELGSLEQGTYAGVLAKVDHIIQTGATTVLLQPVAASARRAQDDAWGAAPVSIFAPEPEFMTPLGGDASHQVRQLIRGLHARGLDVLMQVVLTQLGEGTDACPDSHSIRGIDAFSYYQLNCSGKLESNPSVSGATVLNLCSHVTRRLVIDSLRHWRTNFGVDGFFVDFSMDINREPSERAALLEAIALDPVLGGKTDSGGVSAAVEVARGHATNKYLSGGGVRLYLTPSKAEVGHRQKTRGWGERSLLYLQDITRFMEGSRGSMGNFASRVCGSSDIIKGHNSSSCGYVINSFTNASIGIFLADVASGIATHAKVRPAVVDDQSTAEETRQSKSIGLDFLSTSAPPKAMPPMPPTPTETNLIMRSLITTLFVSDGIPLINAGDEYGHSRQGRYGDLNPWKNEKDGFRWDAVETGTVGHAIHSFIAALSAFRKRRADLFSSGGANVCWTTIDGHSPPKWNDPHAPHMLMCRRKASSRQDQGVGGGNVASLPTQDVVTIFNGTRDLQGADVGQPPAGFAWVRVVDTSLVFPTDCTLDYVLLAGPRGTYLVSPHAVVVLELAPAPEGYMNRGENP